MRNDCLRCDENGFDGDYVLCNMCTQDYALEIFGNNKETICFLASFNPVGFDPIWDKFRAMIERHWLRNSEQTATAKVIKIG